MTSSAPSAPPPDIPEALGRVLLVTGAAGGIGGAAVRHFIDAGDRVAAVDLEQPEAAGDGLVTIAADLATAEGVEASVAACIEAFGRIDHVVHCAGRTGQGPLTALSLEEWDEGLAVNLTSAFLIARAVHPHLAAGRGSLVLLGSPNGVHGGTSLSGPAYASAKAGLHNLVRYLAKEWAPDGIRVNCVIPGTVDTPMLARLSEDQRDELARSVPLGRLVDPDEVAGAIAFLCSPAASAMTGAMMNVTGGRLLT